MALSPNTAAVMICGDFGESWHMNDETTCRLDRVVTFAVEGLHVPSPDGILMACNPLAGCA